MDLEKLNDLLGRELGRRADGHPIFAWKNSDDLWWPAYKTGRNVVTRIEVPLVLPVEVDCPECKGTGIEPDWELAEDEAPSTCASCHGDRKVVKTSDFAETVLPEYRRDRQMRSLDTWVVTKWLSPEELIWGWMGRHGQPGDGPRPSQARLEELWSERFPGADFPSAGWRVPTDATLPRGPGMPRVPNRPDTERFIASVKEQTRLGAGDRLRDMIAQEDAESAAQRVVVEDEIRDTFGAFLNPRPGARGGFLSLPWTRRDRES